MHSRRFFFTVSVSQERVKANDEYLLWWSYLACLNCCVINGCSLFQRVTTGQVYVCYVTDALSAYSDVTWTSCLNVGASQVSSIQFIFKLLHFVQHTPANVM